MNKVAVYGVACCIAGMAIGPIHFSGWWRLVPAFVGLAVQQVGYRLQEHIVNRRERP